MQTIAFTGLGGTDGIELQETDEPSVDDDEVRLDVAAVALNRHDLAVLQGDSWVSDRHLPFVSGLDVAGTIDRVGDDVDGWERGDRVLAGPGRSCGVCEYCRDGPETLCERFHLAHGGFAEQVSVPADRLLPVPDSLSLAEAASLPTSGMTAWQMIRRAAVSAGDTVLVPGATGGVGVAAVQQLDAFGIDSVATSRSQSKLETLAELGATETLVVETADELSAAVEEVTTPDAAVNHLGGDYVTESLRTVDRGGTVVVCGATAGGAPQIDLQGMYVSHKRLVGSSMGTQTDLERIVKLTVDGRLEPVIGAEYPFDAAAEAFASLAESAVVGKVLLRPDA